MKRNSITWILAITAFFFMVANPIASYCALNENPTTAGDFEILTPRPKPQPRINGPLVYGCRPGHPFLYRIPCQGERPIRFTVKGLPKELILDPATGVISGIDFTTDLEKRPEAKQLLFSLKKYMAGNQFNPKVDLGIDKLNGLIQ